MADNKKGPTSTQANKQTLTANDSREEVKVRSCFMGFTYFTAAIGFRFLVCHKKQRLGQIIRCARLDNGGFCAWVLC